MKCVLSNSAGKEGHTTHTEPLSVPLSVPHIHVCHELESLSIYLFGECFSVLRGAGHTASMVQGQSVWHRPRTLLHSTHHDNNNDILHVQCVYIICAH